jgi:hypothetical protein
MKSKIKILANLMYMQLLVTFIQVSNAVDILKFIRSLK